MTSPNNSPTGFLASVFSLPTFLKLQTNTPPATPPIPATPAKTTDEQPCKQLYTTLVHCLNTCENEVECALYQQLVFECVDAGG